MKRAVIFGSVPIKNSNYISEYLLCDDFIIAADGGRITTDKLGLEINWFVGDNDSGGYTNQVPSDILPSEKDVTDLDMAVSRALDEDCSELLLFGCTGGRQDHHLSAIGQLERINDAGANGIIIDESNEIRLLKPGKTVVPYHPGFRYFGVIPLDKKLESLTITGAKYEVKSFDLFRNTSLGVSNQQIQNLDTIIQYQKGIGLLIHSERI